MTQEVAAPWMAAWLAVVHWHSKSVAPQLVAEEAASSMQLWAQLGMSETHWAEARVATAAAMRAEYFILTGIGVCVIGLESLSSEGIEMLWDGYGYSTANGSTTNERG